MGEFISKYTRMYESPNVRKIVYLGLSQSLQMNIVIVTIQ